MPIRLLVLGMPFTILATALAASLFFPELSFWEASLVGVLLAPTDATLGQAVVTSAAAVDYGHRKGWMADQAEGIVALALAFLAGLAFGNTLGRRCSFLFEFAEAEGLLLILTTFFVFGSTMLPEALSRLTPRIVVFALLSPTVLRMVPVGMALLGTRVGFKSAAFLGWFGPRGLATVLFVLLIVEDLEMAGREAIVTAVLTTVVLSILLHGLTAGPLSRGFGTSSQEQVGGG